jgi:RND family efflux transporter MFP subunit
MNERTLFLTIALALLGACQMTHADPGSSASDDFVQVRTSGVTKIDIEGAIELPGRLEPYSSVELRPRVEGRLKLLNVDIGSKIKTGEILAVIDVPDLERRAELLKAEREEAKAAVKARKEALKLAKLNHNRLEKVAQRGRGMVSQQKRDEAKSALKLARAEVAQAKAHFRSKDRHLKLVKTHLGFAKLKAPFDGVVSARYQDRGDLVSQRTPIFRVEEVSIIRAVAYVPASDTGSLDETARVHLEFPGTNAAPIVAPLKRIAGAIDPDTQALRVEAHISLPEGVRAGAYVRFRLEPKVRKGVLSIPAAALHLGPKLNHIYVVKDGVCALVEIATGADSNNQIEVLRGLSGDEQVVVSTRGTLKDGRACRDEEGR